MTVLAGSTERGGLLAPMPSSAGISRAAEELQALIGEIVVHLARSLAVRHTTEQALVDLERAQMHASIDNWDGYGARAMDPRAYSSAVAFLRALPTTAPVPDISVDPDGEVDVMWQINPRRTLSVSVGPTGLLTYAALIGEIQSFGTERFASEIPQVILLNLVRVLDSDPS